MRDTFTRVFFYFQARMRQRKIVIQSDTDPRSSASRQTRSAAQRILSIICRLTSPFHQIYLQKFQPAIYSKRGKNTVPRLLKQWAPLCDAQAFREFCVCETTTTCMDRPLRACRLADKVPAQVPYFVQYFSRQPG